MVPYLNSVPPFMFFILSRVVANVFLCCTVVVASSVLPCIELIAQHISYIESVCGIITNILLYFHVELPHCGRTKGGFQ